MDYSATNLMQEISLEQDIPPTFGFSSLALKFIGRYATDVTLLINHLQPSFLFTVISGQFDLTYSHNRISKILLMLLTLPSLSSTQAENSFQILSFIDIVLFLRGIVIFNTLTGMNNSELIVNVSKYVILDLRFLMLFISKFAFLAYGHGKQ